MLHASGALQVVMFSIALFSLCAASRALFTVYMMYAADIGDAEAQQLIFAGLCECFSLVSLLIALIPGVAGGTCAACLLEMAVSLIAAIRIGYHLHKNMMPYDAFYTSVSAQPAVTAASIPKQVLS